MKKPFIIGITGCSASGKTLILQRLVEALGTDNASVLSQDNYYRPIDEQLIDENGIENFDVPESIDQEAFAQDVEKLSIGEKVERKEYVFNNSDAKPNILTTLPAPIIIVEGIFVFYVQKILDQLDLKVFVDAHEEIMLQRRIKRDAIERGYDQDDVEYRFKHHVMPMFNEHILPHRATADIVIPNNEDGFDRGLAVLAGYLKGIISYSA